MVKKLCARFWRLGQSKAKDRAYYEGLLPYFPFCPEQGITRCIHQTYHRKELPQDLVNNIAHIRALNPGYDYKLWDDADIETFISSAYGEGILAIYKKIVPRYGAARADLFRYLLIYRLWGVYIDIKSSLDKALSEVIRPEDTCLLSHWDNLPGQEHEGWTTQHQGLEASPRGEYVQWYLAYSAGHPLLREIILEVLQRIDNYNPFVQSVGRGGVLSTTGPIPYSLAILKHLEQYQLWVRIAELPELGFIYSIYDRQGALYQHKKVMPANYWRLTMPVVASSNLLIQSIATLFLKAWYAFLDFRWWLSGREGQRS